MKIYALINTQSGSVPHNAEDALSAQLKNLGKDAEILAVTGAELENALEKIMQASPDLLIVWGGDGTHAMSLKTTSSLKIPVMPLPGGTMNLLPKRVYGDDCQWEDCLATLAHPHEIVSLSAGRIEEHFFYIAANVGPLSELSAARECIREGEIVEAVKSLIESDVGNFEEGITLRNKNLDFVTKANAFGVFVPKSAGDLFQVISVDPDNFIDAAATGITAWVNGVRDAVGTHVHSLKKGSFKSEDGKPISANIDGELVELPSGFEFDLQRDAGFVMRRSK